MYQLIQHKNLNIEKWARYPKSQQVLMIANELNRAKNWIKEDSLPEVNNCYERALELTDLTTADLKWPRKAKREIRRFREMLAEQYMVQKKNADINTCLYNLLLQTTPEAWNMLNAR